MSSVVLHVRSEAFSREFTLQLLLWLAVIVGFCVQLKYSNKDWTWTKNQCNSAYKRWTQARRDGGACSKLHTCWGFLLLLCQIQLRKHGLWWSGLRRSATVLDVGEPHERYRMRGRSACFRRVVFHCIKSGISETPLRNVSGFYVNCLKLRTFNPSYSDKQK